MTQNTDSTDDDRGTVPRDQLETVMQFLEESHGDALRRPWSDEAHAYYTAIDILEAAMNDELKPPEDIHQFERQREHIEQSREAREEGYRAATCLGGESGATRVSRVESVTTNERAPTFLGRLREIFE